MGYLHLAQDHYIKNKKKDNGMTNTPNFDLKALAVTSAEKGKEVGLKLTLWNGKSEQDIAVFMKYEAIPDLLIKIQHGIAMAQKEKKKANPKFEFETAPILAKAIHGNVCIHEKASILSFESPAGMQINVKLDQTLTDGLAKLMPSIAKEVKASRTLN